MKAHKLTYALLILVFATLGLAVGGHQQPQRDQSRENEYLKQQQDNHLRFPVADYEEKDLPDPKKNEARKEKQKRHDNFKFVAKNPPPWETESLFVPEGNFNFPALPVNASQLVAVGRVTEASAHLSADKMNVYSEFVVGLSSVLKTASKEINENSVLTIERLGGIVRYPNGQTILFHISGWNMPAVSREYLFFLNSRNRLDWEIVTAYELTENGVLPLDESSQFEALRGKPSMEVLKQVRALTSEPPAR